MRIPIRTTLGVGFLLLVTGCVLDPIDNERRPNPQVSLQGFLTPDAPVDSIILRRTIPPGEYIEWMDATDYGISGANVLLTRVGGATVTLPEISKGVYGDPAVIAEGGATYEIEVTFSAGHEFAARRLTASTTVPDPVTMTITPHPGLVGQTAVVGDTLMFPEGYADPDQFDEPDIDAPFNVSWDPVPNAAGYFVAIGAQDTTGDRILRKRVYEDWLTHEDWLSTPSTRQYLQWNVYYVLPDSLNTDVFWLFFFYESQYDIVLFAADQAQYDYWRTIFQGGGGDSGSDADRDVYSNVSGGVGIFGSFSSDKASTYIKAQWRPSDYVFPKD